MKDRKLLLLLGSICVILVFAVLPFVTACSTTSTTTQAPVTVTQTATATATATATTTATQTATTTLAKAPVAVKEWDFPFIDTLTGAMAASGNLANWAVQQAVTEINAAGGIRGVPIKIIVYDDAYSPTQAVSIAAKVIPGSLILLGPENANSDVACAQLITTNRIASFGMTDDPAMRNPLAPYGISCMTDMVPGVAAAAKTWLPGNASIKKVALLWNSSTPIAYRDSGASCPQSNWHNISAYLD